MSAPTVMEIADLAALLLPELDRKRNGAVDWRIPIAGDPHRPLCHYLPPRGWMNDPNGLIHFRGEYHLFHQFNPHGTRLCNIAWAHARSRDLVNWEILPLALEPDHDYDRFGVWSGSIVGCDGRAAALYTGVSNRIYHPQRQCLAFSDDLVRWDKWHANPVIPRPPAFLPITEFRDPWVWRHDDEWLMALGSSLLGRGAILLYSSADLLKWHYRGPLLTGRPGQGSVWECPNFFPLGGRWVLIVSLLGDRAIYFTGTFSHYRFHPELMGEIDTGGSLYAPQTFSDDSGRRILFGWLRENRPDAARRGWQGVQSFPRVLTMGDGGLLRFAPAEELRSLRDTHTRFQDIVITEDTPLDTDCSSECFEIEADMQLSSCHTFGLSILHASSGTEKTLIRLNRSSNILEVIVNGSSRASTALPQSSSDSIRLHVFFDRSVIEVYADDVAVLSCRVYPKRSGPTGLTFFSEGCSLRIAGLDIWALKPANIRVVNC